MFSRNLYEVICPFHSTPLVLHVQLGQGIFPTCPKCKSRLLLDGRYALRGVLGEGGFGRVFWAVDLADDLRRVTVKQAVYQGKTGSNEMKSEVISQMICESQILHQLSHRQIPELLALFSENREVFLVEEYMKGDTLHEVAEKKHGIPCAEAREVLADIVPVLIYLHDGFVVPLAHNDISPRNIITPAPERKRHALIDLGSTRQLGNSPDELRAYHPLYAAPEVVAQYQISPASDQYSLGTSIICAMAGGDMPRTANRAYDFWQGHLKEVARRGQDQALVGVLSKMTQLNPQDRYRDLREVLSDLARSSQRVVAPSERLLAGHSGYVKIHDVELLQLGRRCRDFQASRDMGTVGFRSGMHRLHVLDMNSAQVVLTLDIGVPFRYRISRDGRSVAVLVHEDPILKNVGMRRGGVFVVDVATGTITILLDTATLSPAMENELQKIEVDGDSTDTPLNFSAGRLFLALNTGFVMGWYCGTWERSENYRKPKGSTVKFNSVVVGGEGLILAGDGSNFVIFEEGEENALGQLTIPSRSRTQRILSWDGVNTWLSHSVEPFNDGKHVLSLMSCDLHDSIPEVVTQSVRETSIAPIADVAASANAGFVATSSVGESFLRLYNSDLKLVDLISTSSPAAQVIFSPRGNYLFACGQEGITVLRRS